MQRFLTILASLVLALGLHAQITPLDAVRLTGANELQSGGTLTIKSGGTFTIESGATFVAPPSIFGSGTALQVLRRNAANTAFEWATVSVGGGDLLAANNLSELTASAATARANLGLTIGTHVLAPNGNGSSLTSLNASEIASGTLPAARLPGLTNAEIAAGAAIALNKLATDPLARANHTGTQAQSTVTNLVSDLTAARVDAKTFGFDNGASVLVAQTGASVVLPYAGTITGWYVRGDVSGSVTVIIERATGAGAFAEISGSGDPALSSATYATAGTTGWSSTTFSAGDSLRASITGTPASLHNVAVVLSVTK